MRHGVNLVLGLLLCGASCTTEPGGGGSGAGGSSQAGGSTGGAGSGRGGVGGSGGSGTTTGGSGGSGGSGTTTGGGGGSGTATGGSGGTPGSSGGGGSGGGGGGTGGGGSGGGGIGDARPEQRPEVMPDVAGSETGGGGSGGGGARFSFFYTSLDAMRRLSNNPEGFGGDLRFGAPTGLEGADKICQTIAQGVGAGGKTWRAFLSAVSGPGGQPVHAIDRIGEGPWYDRNGRLIAMNKAGLTSGNRPMGEAQAVADLPDENGRGTRMIGDTHDVITASNQMGRLRSTSLASTCQDWTSATGGSNVGAGHSWPASSGMHWIQAHTVPGCTPSVNTTFTPNNRGIGGYGGWGGFYCFALTP